MREVDVPEELSSPYKRLPKRLLMAIPKLTMAIIRGLIAFSKWMWKSTIMAITKPQEFRAAMAALWRDIKHEVQHYAVGSKLLWAELKTSVKLLRRLRNSEELTRRERLQLKRTMGDLLRMVPLFVILVIPAAELSLPFLLKVFPTMLPSPFTTDVQLQDQYRRSLKLKLEVHSILQEILADQIERATSAQARQTTAAAAGAVSQSAGPGSARSTDSVASLLRHLEEVRAGKVLPGDTIVEAARIFRDDITLDTLPRGQLASIARFVGISPYLPEPVMRYKLRQTFASIKEDDQLLHGEGVEALTEQETCQACELRGIPSHGQTQAVLRAQLEEWLTLSVERQVPITLLLLSRAFKISTAETPEAAVEQAERAIQESLTVIDDRTFQEVVLAQSDKLGLDVGDNGNKPSSTTTADATPKTAIAPATAETVTEGLTGSPAEPSAAETLSRMPSPTSTDLLAMKLESIQLQNALIEAEREALESAKDFDVASREARQKLALAREAESDPLRADEFKRLLEEANTAARVADEKAALASAKRQHFHRMRGSVAPSAEHADEEHMAGQEQAVLSAAVAAAEVLPKPPSAAPAAPAVADEEDAIAALSEVAVGATVARERELLRKIKQVQRRLEAADMLAQGRITTQAAPGATGHAAEKAAATPATSGAAKESAAPKAKDKAAKATAGVNFLKSRLDHMLADLEKEVETVGTAVDSSVLRALVKADSDKDGAITEAELRAALRSITGSEESEDAAAALIKHLDNDKDGAITVAALDAFLDVYSEKLAKAEADLKSKAEARARALGDAGGLRRSSKGDTSDLEDISDGAMSSDEEPVQSRP